MSRRGLSSLIVSVLVILISIVAVILVAPYFLSLTRDVSQSSSSASQYALFLDIPLGSVFVEHETKEVTLLIERRAGQGDVQGFIVVLEDEFGNSQTYRGYESRVIHELESVRVSFTHTLVGRVVRINVAPVITSSDGSSEVGSPLEPITIGFDGRAIGSGSGGSSTIIPTNPTPSNPSSCQDGQDNDEDGWIDAQDEDCMQGGAGDELWVALSECSDKIDNDGDGRYDSHDRECSNGADTNERDAPDNPPCSNGLDDDGDFLVDYPIDPGCTSFEDSSESDEGVTHGFSFVVGDSTNGLVRTPPLRNDMTGTFIRVSLDAIPSRPVVWEQTVRTNRAFNSDSLTPIIRFHDTPRLVVLDPTTQFPWSISRANGDRSEFRDEDMTYEIISRENDRLLIDARVSDMTIHDRFIFRGNRIYWALTFDNPLSERIAIRDFPVTFPNLYLGSYDSSGYFVTSGNTIMRYYQGKLETSYVPSGSSSIRSSSYAPVRFLGDQENFMVGLQLLTPLYLPDTIEFQESLGTATPGMRSFLDLDVPASSSRTVVIVFNFVSDGGDWQSALDPYYDAFGALYGGYTPRYCPSSFVTTQVGSSVAGRDRSSQSPFFPEGMRIDQFVSEGTSARLERLGVSHAGIWDTAIYSSEILSSGVFEYNPRIDLFDPHLDIAHTPVALGAFTSRLNNHGIDTFWFSRICADIPGADVTYMDDGSFSTSRGTVHWNDLRYYPDRQRYFSYMQQLIDQGVSGFYIDQPGCAGDESFMAELSRRLPDSSLPVVMETARDRTSLWWPQIPIVKYCAEGLCPDYNLLSDYLVPQGVYYGGGINTPLSESETLEFISQGGIGIGGSLLFGPSSSFYCSALTQSYRNAHDRWALYGRTVLNCLEPRTPVCP